LRYTRQGDKAFDRISRTFRRCKPAENIEGRNSPKS
jgi:hypothetical protein